MRTVFFDASRLFIRGSRFSPTGIDRVVLAYARWLTGRTDIDLRPVITFGGRLWEAPRALLAGIVEGTALFHAAGRGDEIVDESWSALLDVLAGAQAMPSGLRAKPVTTQLPARVMWHAAILARSIPKLRPVLSLRDALYVNVSHTGLGDPTVLPRLMAKGARNIVLVHDLIPIEHPEYCAPGARGRHIRRLENILGHTALAIVNSQTTGNSLAAYAKQMARPCPQIKVAYLGVEPPFISRPEPIPSARPYFVHVGTLEARKNLAFLLAIWRRLYEEQGAQAPYLILVGRRGWENEAVVDQLDRSEAAKHLVHEVNDLQDSQLARLIAGARALLAPSFTEGYDLPVMEALSLGTPVIASDIPVHRELAGASILIDPLDGAGWLRAIKAAKPDRGPLFSAPTWQDHFAALADTPLG
jgi:glycosyltransferase involved in cell wall biosynthesis